MNKKNIKTDKTMTTTTEAQDSRSVREKINAGVYETKRTLPKRTDPGYKEALSSYHEEQASLIAQLYKDVLVEYNLESNPKAGILWAKAWELGHSSGLSSIIDYIDELVDLIR